MAESNATQVILTDDGLKIIKAQNTADNAAGGVTNLNDPNLMNVIEKQTVVSQYAGLTSQYNVILARAKDASISTTDLTTAYTNLNNFITPLLKDTTKASNIDRYTYNSLTYAYNVALSNVQTALKDAYNTDIDNMQSSVSVASQAASSAVIVASQAAITGDTANQVASRAIVVANDAQSAGNNAISVANNASQAASGAVIAGSTASVNADKAVKVASQAQIAGNNATSVANNASQAASNAILAGSTATVIANKASTVANEAKSAGDDATSVANNATSVANSARSVADNTYAYANSEISIQSTATAKAQSAADNAFSKAQAVGSQASAEIAVQSNATAKAQSTADNAFSQAQAVGSQASAEINSNSTATAKAQSTADNAFSQATTAIDNGKVTSQAVTDLKDGSKLTIAELENGLATKVANSDYASYKEQTASQIGQLVTNGTFSAYQTQTADLIAQKVATSDFSAYQATTAKEISSKVESNDFNTYKTQTADLIDDKVSNSAYASDKTQTASEIADRVSNSAFSTYQTQTASQIASKVDNGDFSTYKTQTADLIGSKVDNGVYQSDKTQTANAISSKVSSSDFNTYKTQTADLIDDKVSNSAYVSDKTQTASEIADRVSNSAFSTYQTQTASQIASKVDNGEFSTYKTQTADLIASKVANKDFSAYQATTAKSIDSKVESSDFNTYKTQTDKAIISKVSTTDLDVPNRNLYTDTRNFDNPDIWSFYSVWHKATDKFNGLTVMEANTPWFGLGQDIQAKKGEVYTFSLYARYESGTGNSTMYFIPSGSTVALSQTNATFSLNETWQRISATFSVNADGQIHPRMERTGDNTNTLMVAGLKLERGTKATPYSIAPEDQATQSQITQLSGELDLRVTKDGLVDQINLQAGNTLISSSGQLTLSGKSVLLDSINPVIMKSANIGNLAVGTAQIANGAITNAQIGSLAVDTANIKDAAINSAKIASLAVGTAQIGNGAITTAKIGKLAVGTAQIANAAITDAQIGSLAVGTAQIKDEAVNSAKIANLAVGTAQIGDGAITNAKIGKLAVGTAQIANAAITDAQIGNVSANKLTAGTIDFNTITGKNINASNITTGTLDTNRLNVNKLSAVSGDLGDITTGTLKGVDIVANTFSTPNGSFTTDASGNVVAKNMTLTGGTLTSPTINASTINGSTINGTTFNAGTRLNSYGNTSYPLTINQDGSVTSTSFGNIANDPAALRTVMKDGMVKTNFRGMNKISNGIYSAADIAMGAGQLALFEGYTKSQDPNFTATGITPTGYVILDASTGLNLHGDNQQITFNGTSDDVTHKGIIITPYGNINPNGTQNIWYVGNGPTMKTASFGIDGSGANNIQFNRSLDIGNFNINTYHTITSSDNGPIHFNRANGSSVDIYAATVHYESLSKVSLLSVKKDVKKADTAYWAQLVNSIDLATYQYKSDDNTSHIRLSSIVDDVNDTKQWQLPDIFISRDEDGKLCGVDDSVLLNATLATVQEQQKEIDQLNGHNMELEARLNKLEAKLNG